MMLLWLLAAVATPTAVTPPIMAAPAATATDPARVAAARRLLEITHIERQYDAMFAQLLPVMSAQVFASLRTSSAVPPALRAELARPEQAAAAQRIFADEMERGFKGEYPALKAATAGEYAALFTLPELTQLAAFYTSPLGQKTLTALPQLQARLMPIGMRAGQAVGRVALQHTLQRLQTAAPKPRT